jgi:hypothetical protein
MAERSPCPWSDCWCRAWPPERVVMSTGERYTIEELEPGVYQYRYLGQVVFTARTER